MVLLSETRHDLPSQGPVSVWKDEHFVFMFLLSCFHHGLDQDKKNISNLKSFLVCHLTQQLPLTLQTSVTALEYKSTPAKKASNVTNINK